MGRNARFRSSGEIWEQSRSRNVSFSTNDIVQSLRAAPDLKMIFQTNACGGIVRMPEDDLATEILFPINYVEKNLQNRVFEGIKFGAIEMGRTVSHYKKDDKYFTEISPVIA